MRENIALWKVVFRGAIPAPAAPWGVSLPQAMVAFQHGHPYWGPARHGHIGGTSDILDFPCRWITQARKVLWGLLPAGGWVCFWVGDSGLVVSSSVLKWHGIACFQGLSLQLKLANSEADKSCGRFNACRKIIFPTLLEKKSILLQLFFSCLISTTEAI